MPKKPTARSRGVPSRSAQRRKSPISRRSANHAGRSRSVAQPSMQRAYLVPSDMTARPGEAEALDILAHVLGSGQNSRLYQALVEDKRIAEQRQCRATRHRLSMRRGSPLYATPQAEIRRSPNSKRVSTRDPRHCRTGSRRRTGTGKNAHHRRCRLRTRQSGHDGALVRMALVTGATVEQVKTWPDRVRAVTADAVRNAARTWLQKPRSVTGYLVKDWRWPKTQNPSR